MQFDEILTRSKLSIIIPFFNEEDNIVNLVGTLSDFFNFENRFDGEVIFVNDGSTDNSKDVLLQQKHFYYKWKLISFSKNFGSHAALRAGIQNSTGDFITFLYADLQDPINLISLLYEKKMSSRKEIVWATRSSTQNSLLESIFSKYYSKLMKKYVSNSYPEKGFDIVFFSKKIAAILNKNIEANSSIFLHILTLGFDQDFILYDKKPRIVGKSKWTINKKIKLFIDSFVAFSYAPIRFVTLIGFILFALGIIFIGYLSFRKFVFDDLVSGWLMLVSILIIGFGVTNISLGIIAEYLWRTFDSSRNRPVFIIDEIIDFKNEKFKQ